MPNSNEPLDVARIRATLAQTRFADVQYVLETGSTNADARELLGASSALGTTLVAEYQTAGAGRKGRQWVGSRGSALLFTAILPEPLATNSLWAVPFWIALGVAAAVERCAGIRLDLVWPNDLHARGAKAGGILSVARVAGDEAWVGCGVGLNVTRPADEAELRGIEPPPVFLDDLAAPIEREALLAVILQTFDRTLSELRQPDAVARSWERRARLSGTRYRYRRDADGSQGEGIAQRLGPHGTLVLSEDAAETAVDMADVRVVGHA